MQTAASRLPPPYVPPEVRQRRERRAQQVKLALVAAAAVAGALAAVVLADAEPSGWNAADALWRLSDAGVWVRVITHRLVTNWGHATIVSDTVEWLDLRKIPYRDLCFLGRKPEVQAHAYVEDAPHNIEALRAGGNTVIVFDQPYNRDLPGPRASNWAEVEELVAELVTERSGSFPNQLPGVDAGADRIERRKSS